MVDKAQYFKSLEDRYGLPEGYLEQTMSIESRGDVRAYNKNSGAAGPFQFIPKSQKEFNLKNPYSLEESAEAAARMAARNKVSLQRNGIESPTGADLYAAHQQGAKGYVDLLKAGDQPASKVVGEDAVVWNGGKPNMSATDFANKITSKFSGGSPSQPKVPEQTATGVLANRNVDVAETPEQAAALEGQQAALSTQDVLDTANSSAGRSGNGLKELGFLHNYFKSLDTSATGVKPLTVPNFFNQPKYKHGGIVSLKKDAEKVRAAGIGGDTVLAHITASEAALLKSMGGSGRINPRTGLPMFGDGEGGAGGRGDGGSGTANDGGGSSGRDGGGSGTANDGGGNQGGNQGGGPGSDPGGTGDFGGGGGGVSDIGGSTGTGGQGTGGKGGEGPGDKGDQGDKGVGDKGVGDKGVEPTTSPEISTKNDVTTQFSNAPEKAPGFDLANTRAAVENALKDLTEAPAAVAKGPNEMQSVQNTVDKSVALDRSIGFTPDAEKAKQEAIAFEALDLMNRAEIGKQAAFSAVTSTPTTTTAEEVEAASSKAAQNAREQAVANALSGLVEAPSAIGVTPSTSVAPSTSTPSQSTPSQSTPSSTNPTASSSTSKGKGYDITGFDFIDSKLSSMINNPTATIAGLAVSAVNPVAGFANAVTGNQIGLAVDRAISSITGTQPGPGNTVTSEEPGTNPASPSTPSGPGPSVGDMTFGGNYSGDSTTYNPVTPATSTSGTTATPINYDVSKFLGALGKSSYTTPASVYTSYPVQQGIGSIAAPQYTGSFYNPSFGKVPYQ